LGFTPFIDRHVIGTVFDAYRDLFPKGDIVPENGDTDDLIRPLIAGELDAALVTLPLIPDGYRVQPIMHEPLVVCLRKDDPLAAMDELPSALLRDWPSSAIPGIIPERTHGSSRCLKSKASSPGFPPDLQSGAYPMDG
jgi:DNA-binding transcriptional LysR family regulator